MSLRFAPVDLGIPDMQGYRAASNNYSFLITLERRIGPDFEGYTGYTASWKPFGTSTVANRIDGGPWKTFKEAEEACKSTWRQLIRKN